MAKMVKAWDKRTGEQLPNTVPQTWLDRGMFPYLAASQGAATAALRRENDSPVQETAKSRKASDTTKEG